MNTVEAILFAWVVIFVSSTVKETVKLILGTHAAAKREEVLIAERDEARMTARRLADALNAHKSAGPIHRQSGNRQNQEPIWCRVLGLKLPVTKEQINTAYRVKAMAAHPDHGGSNEAMAALNEARRDALASIN